MAKRHPPITLTCDYCGKEFKRRYSYHRFLVEKKGITAKFCKHACKAASQEISLPEDAIVARYKSGESLDEIGSSLGISGGTIRNRLIKLGVELRSRAWHISAGRNPTKGKGHTEETKQLIRDHAIKQFSTEEARAMARHNQILAIANGKIEKTSQLENIVASLLDDMGILYQRQKPLRDPKTGRFFACVDFLLEDGIVIEVNGSFWHADSRLYPDGPQHDCQRKTLANDKQRKQKMRELNIPIIEVWGLDIREDIDKVRCIIENR